MIDLIQTLHNIGFVVTRTKPLDGVLHPPEQARQALAVFADDAILVAIELIDHGLWQNHCDLALFNKRLKARQQGLLPVIFGKVEPDARVDEHVKHG